MMLDDPNPPWLPVFLRQASQMGHTTSGDFVRASSAISVSLAADAILVRSPQLGVEVEKMIQPQGSYTS